MKKIISFLIIFSFLFAVAAFSPISALRAETNSTAGDSQTELEKIPSPQHINLYEKIKKVGNTLWGIKKAAQKQIKQEQEKLEKIASPKEIYLFEKIKKVGNALWGIRKKILYRAVTSENAPCVIAAIEIKDKALIDNNTNTVAELNKAIVARTACQKTALATTDNQKKALDECARIFKDAYKLIKFNSNKTATAIAKTYRDSLKVCAKTVSTGDISTSATASQEINIEDGGGNIIDATEDKD